jgi:hypothetical protein
MMEFKFSNYIKSLKSHIKILNRYYQYVTLTNIQTISKFSW